MHFTRPHSDSSPASSLLLVPLLVAGLALNAALCPVQAAPMPASKQVSFTTSSSRGSSNDAVVKAAKLSRPANATVAQQLLTKAEETDFTPWAEVHQVALPKPASHGRNATTINAAAAVAVATPKNPSATTALSAKKKTKSKSKSKSKNKKKKKKAKSKTNVKATSNSKSTSTTSASKSASTASTGRTSTDDCDDVDDGVALVPTTGVAVNASLSCFPALDFTMPSSVPSSLDGWWCDAQNEYAFMGFSYDTSACQSQAQLTREFKDARQTYNARYVRLYGTCDSAGFYDRVVNAAWDAGIGVQALIWFGFDGDSKWKGRRDTLLSTLHSNPKARFVTRAVQFGSEPLFDWAISGTTLAKQVTLAKQNLSDIAVNVTVSEMAYGYQTQSGSGSMDVLKAIDFIDAHMLPYFAQDASTGSNAWRNNANDMAWFTSKAPGKKIYWSQTGWPSSHNCNEGVCPNSAKAVSDLANEKAYYDLLDSKCTTLKAYPGGGVGWFAHVYSDAQLSQYGVVNTSGKAKFAFAPKTSC